MKTHEEIAEAALKMLRRAVDNDPRIKRGLQLRAQMHEELESKGGSSSYRAKWVHKSAVEVITALSDIGQRFNNVHLSDHSSVYDLLDILATATLMVKKAANIKDD